MNITFENKTVLVTGTGRGIGLALVEAFVQCKAEKVYGLVRNQSGADALKSKVPSAEPLIVDLCDWNTVRTKVQAVGRIDILINNAGIAVLQPFIDVKPETFDEMFSVNVKAVINVSQLVIEKMIEGKKGGSIVTLSSQASKIALMDHTVYCATKAALDSITRSIALEYGKYNIRANTVNPTVVLTDMGRMAWSDPKKAGPILNRIPLHKFAEVEDVVHAVLFLSSDKAAMINATNLPIEGGILGV